jgi:hypothetical protein
MPTTLRRTASLSLAALLLIIGCGCAGADIQVINTDPNNPYYPGRMMAPDYANPGFLGNAWTPY